MHNDVEFMCIILYVYVQFHKVQQVHLQEKMYSLNSNNCDRKIEDSL